MSAPGSKPKLNLDSVVAVTNEGNTIGSGSVIHSEPRGDQKFNLVVITAKHVVLHAPKPGIKIYNGPAALVTKVTPHPDTECDLAILHCVCEKHITPSQCQFIDPTALEIGYTVGYPLAITRAITAGLINQSVANNVNKYSWLCTCPAIFGNSGGGVFNAEGLLLGVTVAIPSIQSGFAEVPVSHLQFFIPISKVSDWVKGFTNGQIKEKETPKTGVLDLR
jgi:S1-C subfamily serine protease